MSWFRVAALVVGTGGLAVWVASPFSTRAVARPPEPTGASSPVPDPLETAIQAQAMRLREHLRAAPTWSQPSRNPFAFAPRSVPQPPRPSTSDPVPTPIVSDRLSMRLIGIAEDVTSAGIERTAVLSVGGRLFFVKEGDTVTTRFRVARLGAEAIQLTDLHDGSTLTLVLK